MNVCLIPCFDRAELLWHTLRNIEKADGAKDILFLFKPDFKTKGEVLDVIGTFELESRMIPYGQEPRIPRIMRQSWNVLTGYGVAARTAGEGGLVYMVESDVIVGRDFFTWHQSVQERVPDNFCSIASADSNTPVEDRPPQTFSKDHYGSHGTYRSIGVCWKAEVLRDHIGPHCTNAYLKNPQHYITSTFHNNPWGRSWIEQDGLIRRIQLNSGLPIAYAIEPKCYHAGYYGGNRGNRDNAPKGGLQQRIEEVGRVIYSKEEMRRVAPSEDFYLDSEPIDLRHPSEAEVTL